MKLIKAYIRQRKIEKVFEALKKEGFCCMTFVECEGTGKSDAGLSGIVVFSVWNYITGQEDRIE